MGDPYLDAGMRGWIHNTARKNFWRVAAWYELEDLVQDGYMCYAKCKAKYTHLSVKNHPDKEDRRCFMGLVAAAFNNHIHTLASKWQPEVAEAALLADGEASIIESYAGGMEGEGNFLASLAFASEEVKALIPLLLQNDPGKRFYRASRPGYRKALRQTTSQHYRRLLGLDGDGPDVRAEIEELFQP